MAGARFVLAGLLCAGVWAATRPATVGLERATDPGDAAHPWADDRDAPFGAAPDDPPGGSWNIDPEPHRRAVERIEAVLYRRSPGGFGDADAAEGGSQRLANDLLRTDRLRGRRAGLELLAFASRIGARTDTGYVQIPLPELRHEWETVRSRVFRPAPWMRTADAELDRIQDPPPPPPDPRTTQVLADAARDLERLLARAERDVERLGEPVYDPDLPGRGDRGQIRAWYRWGERWREDLLHALASARALDPAPHPGRQPHQAAALRSLEEAAEMLRRVPDGAGMWPTPFRPSWQARFRAARAALAEARARLADAERRRPAGRGLS